jgi:hypothetical protein
LRDREHTPESQRVRGPNVEPVAGFRKSAAIGRH